MNKRILSLLVGIMVCSLAWCATTPVEGKYYRIVNQNSDKKGVVITESTTSHTLSCNTAGSATTYNQLWLYTGGKLQNALTKYYIVGNTTASYQFSTASAGTSITLETMDDGHFAIKCGGYMHADGGNALVCWNDIKNESNHWDFQAVTVNETTLATAQENYRKEQEDLASLRVIAGKASTYATKLGTFFADDACTKLNSTYATMSDADLCAAMEAAGLPTVLQQIAVKVKNNWWTDTTNSPIADTNKYAEEFRVHDYQPYSDANRWRDERMMTYSLCYMGNPTGIYASGAQLISVFVGDDIPDGATLYLAGVASTTLNTRIQSATYGTQLKKGLNMLVTDGSDLMYYILYTVNTVDLKKKIADYPSLKIHIEGGEALGFYTKPKVNSAEEDAKYVYLKDHGKSGHVFVVKGENTLFTYDRDAYNYSDQWKKSIFNSIDWYDKVEDWEHALMGLKADVANGLYENTPANANCPINITGGNAWYPTYCNNPIMSMQGADSTNPYATYFAISMPGFGGIESSFNADRENFDTWCTGHEHGHQNQLVINLESSTESSNNLFSNLVTYLTGYRMSRGGSFKENEEYNLNHTVFGLRSIGMTHRMYWNMYLYYHLAGKNKSFYPTLFQSLRDDRLQLGTGTESWLKFYKKACDAAQEDLTEYFRLWGFFEPCKNTVFGDYTSYTVNLSQAQIDAAIASVKAKGYPENKQIMFIEDRIKPLQRTDIWASKATGSKTIKPDNGGNWITDEQRAEYYGDLGMFDDFIDGNQKAANYTYTASGTNITMNGEGGVGFIVYDKDGNIAFMSNELEFTIPLEVAVAGYTIETINADGTEVAAVDAAESGTDDQRLAALQASINATSAFTSLSDDSGKKVGYYSTEALSNLNDLIKKGNDAITNSDAANYASISKDLNTEMLRLQVGGAMNSVKPTGIYTIYSKREQRYMYTTTAGTSLTTNTSGTSNSSRWAFVPTDNGTYYLQNRNSRNYVGITTDSEGSMTGWNVKAAKQPEAFEARLVAAGDGTFYIEPTDYSTSMNTDPTSKNIVKWSADEGSKWYITLCDEMPEYTNEDIQELIDATQTLVDKVAVYSTSKDKLPLQGTSASEAYYISTNQEDANYPIANLIDGKSSTYFMTSSTATSKEYHNLKIDLGANNALQNILFYYRTHTAGNNCKPTKIIVQASATGTSWTKVTEITDLPNATTKTESYTSNTISATKAYRYWRLQIASTNASSATTYPYFSMADLYLYAVNNGIVMNPGYEEVSESLVSTAASEKEDATQSLSGITSVMINMDTYTALKKAYDALFEAAASCTGINGVVITPETRSYGIFDLSGRRVSNMNKAGIYIVNGKKVLVK